ncbi:MAG TPA: NYN domain-containing protein [Lacunisphaera sp.]|jgi:uncharacterized LabA/DUF88 family protein
MASPNPSRKVIAYVDGFNLYYGLLKDRPDLKWLNLNKLVKMLFPHYELGGVKYFTAEVEDASRKERQKMYWRALRKEGVKVIPGRLEYREKNCGVTACMHHGPRTHRIPVEKMTDVNIALHAVTDARNLGADAICIISGDTDLIPAMDMIRANFKIQRFAFIPCTEAMLSYRRVDEFGMHDWETKRLKEEVLSSCRFEEEIIVADEQPIICPAAWRRAKYVPIKIN